MRKQIIYRFVDGVTPLSADELNRRFFDLDARIHALEETKISWNEVIATLKNDWFTRSNEVLAEYIVELQEEMARLPNEIQDFLDEQTQILEELRARNETLWSAINELVSSWQNMSSQAAIPTLGAFAPALKEFYLSASDPRIVELGAFERPPLISCWDRTEEGYWGDYDDARQYWDGIAYPSEVLKVEGDYLSGMTLYLGQLRTGCVATVVTCY